MSRNIRDGQRRRSPRISAVDAWKPHQRTHPTSSSKKCMWDQDHQGPPSRTRARIKRKLQQLGTKSPNHEDCSTSSDRPSITKAKGRTKLDDHVISTGQPSVMSPVPFMPQKRILELVLDVLQRRDTYEIFGEPVDPKEVEDYYEIIKEPMDFGTMRAKLHEGLYTDLDQFEHDAFLIPRNAMHFNSTATIYFRQARAIYELAKRVFHVLRNDPQNFELEFSRTRRRSGRRVQREGKGLNYNSCPRLATNVRSSTLTTDVSSKRTRCSLSGLSNLRRHSPGFSCKDTCENSGARDCRKSNFFEVDRCCTYRPLMSFHDENDPFVSKTLARVNQRDISYKESLMLFAKGLGPTAQMVANRKLQECQEDGLNLLNPASNCTSQVSDPLSGSLYVPRPTVNLIDLTDTDDGEKANRSDKKGHHTSFLCGKVVSKNDDGIKIFSSCDRDKVLDNQISKLHPGLKSSLLRTEDLSSSVIKNNGTTNVINKESVATTEAGSSKMKKSNSWSWPWHTDGSGGTSGSSQASCHSLETNRLMPLTSSPFAFDLPFLKSRLDRMTRFGQGGFLQHSLQQVSGSNKRNS